MWLVSEKARNATLRPGDCPVMENTRWRDTSREFHNPALDKSSVAVNNIVITQEYLHNDGLSEKLLLINYIIVIDSVKN